MKKFASFASFALAAASLVAGCAVDPVDGATAQEESIGTGEAAVCSNPDGTNAMLAALAGAIATELHRFEIVNDFEIYRGTYNQEMLRISQLSRSFCTNNCRNIDALLAFQDARNDQIFTFKDGTKLSSWNFASRLVTGYRAQKACLDRFWNGDPSACVTEWHYLEKVSSVPTTCNGTDYGLRMMKFKVSKANMYGQKLSPEQPLTNPDPISRKLLWADGDQNLPVNGNPFLQFRVLNNKVEIELDPSEGTSEDPIPAASCGTASLKYYPSPNPDITGKCCTAVPRGLYRKYNLPGTSSWGGWYKCQL